jgi:hypothetical protein
MWIRRLSELTLAACLGLAAADARAQSAASSPDDALAAHRERFKQGMDLYEHGSAAAAIAVWEPIYRDLGPQRGYRLAYDLGLAYAALDDAARSADRLQVFLTEVDARRGRAEALGAAVTNEESDARARLAHLAPILGRVQVAAGSAPSTARIDAGDARAGAFLAWVASGPHTVTFDPGTRDERQIAIDVAAGAVVELVPPSASSASTSAAPAAPAPATPAAPAPFASSGSSSTSATSAPSSAPGLSLPSATSEPPHAPSAPMGSRSAPFSPAVIAVSGGLTLAALAAAIVLEAHANTLRDRFTAEQASSADGTIPAADRSSFATARTWAYVTVGGAAGFAAITGGLAGWYLLGKRPGETPATSLAVRGSRLVLEGSF